MQEKRNKDKPRERPGRAKTTMTVEKTTRLTSTLGSNLEASKGEIIAVSAGWEGWECGRQTDTSAHPLCLIFFFFLSFFNVFIILTIHLQVVMM
jgi:hypothetical protein